MSRGRTTAWPVMRGEQKEGSPVLGMALDLHVHALLSKSFPFEVANVERSQTEARRVGLAGFALTEHIHARDYWRAQDELCRRFSYSEGTFRGGTVPMLSGAEITIADAGDVIVVGELEALERLDRHFCPALSADHHPPLGAFLDAIERYGLVVIAAHPFRPGKYLARSARSDLARFAAIELNGKDAFLIPHTVAAVRRLAKQLRRPLVASSDAHLWPQIGVAATLLPPGEVTLAHLRRALAEQTTGQRLRRHGRGLVRFCRTHKTLVKARRAGELSIAAAVRQVEELSAAAVA